MKTFIACLLACAATPALASQPSVKSEPMFVAYPRDAFDAKLEGRVAVELQISAAGAVEDCKVVTGVAESLDAASCNYWRCSTFRAAYDGRGAPVPATIRKYSDWRLPR